MPTPSWQFVDEVDAAQLLLRKGLALHCMALADGMPGSVRPNADAGGRIDANEVYALASSLGETDRLGRAGEKAAAELLKRRGYEVVAAGFMARRGEIDLICRRGSDLVIVEVKTRTRDAFGTPDDLAIWRR